MLALDEIAASASNIERAARERDLSGTEIGLHSLAVAVGNLQERE